MPIKDHSLLGKLIHIRSCKLLFSLAAVLPKHTDVAWPQIIT